MNEMARAYDLAALAVRQRLAEQHPERLEVLNRLRKRDVAVYEGQYDSVEEVLRRLSIPFQLNPARRALGKARIAFANCTGNALHPIQSGAEPFVRDGGWLVSTDWSLHSVVQNNFPGTIRRKAGQNSADEVVAVEPDLGSLWSEVVVLGTDPQWWLEGSSYPIEVLDRERVRVEAASHELWVKYEAPAVSVRFDWQGGHVYHVISHLWLKRTRAPQSSKYRGPCTDFLREGMRLSESGIDRLLAKSKLTGEDLDFATIQSAATATELVAQLCIEAAGSEGTAKKSISGGVANAIK